MAQFIPPKKPYESEAMRTACGDTLRPGGFSLTERAVDLCGIKSGIRLLDVGCGMGASVEHLIRDYGIDAMGIDPSDKMIDICRSRSPELPVFKGMAEHIDLPDNSMKIIMSECSLSQVEDIEKALREFFRVMEEDGRLIISDMYIRQYYDKISSVPSSNIQRGFMYKEEILSHIDKAGFKPVFWEDHTDKLTQLVCDIIMEFGSMPNFWSKAGGCENACISPNIKAKMGYYLMIARKK